MNEQMQQKTVDLARGLFLVRYNGADDKLSPPVVRVYADRASLNNCNIITGPDVANGTLFAPEARWSCRSPGRAADRRGYGGARWGLDRRQYQDRTADPGTAGGQPAPASPPTRSDPIRARTG